MWLHDLNNMNMIQNNELKLCEFLFDGVNIYIIPYL